MAYFQFTNSYNSSKSHCGLEIVFTKNAVVVITKEIPDNKGMSIYNAFEDLFFQICRRFHLDAISENIVWIQTWEDRIKSEEPEEWSLVQYKIKSSNQACNPEWCYLGNSREEAFNALEKQELL